MTIGQCEHGAIVETLSDGLPTGNVYKLAGSVAWSSDKRRAWKAYRQGKVILAASVSCRLLESFDSGEFQF